MERELSKIKEGIEKKDSIIVHSNMCSIIRQDPTFSTNTFDKALKIIEQEFPEAVEEHDNRIEEPRSKWNSDYWAFIVTDLMDNFSRERIKHLKEVSKVVYGNINKKTIEQATASQIHTNVNRDSAEKKSITLQPWMIVAGIVVGIITLVTLIAKE